MQVVKRFRSVALRPKDLDNPYLIRRSLLDGEQVPSRVQQRRSAEEAETLRLHYLERDIQNLEVRLDGALAMIDELRQSLKARG